MNNEGYLAGEAESEAIEAVLKKYDQEQAKTTEPVSNSSFSETVYLYINTGLGKYSLVDHPFVSKADAAKYANKVYPNTKFKTLTQTEVQAYTAKQERKTVKNEAIKTKVKGASMGASVAIEKAYQELKKNNAAPTDRKVAPRPAPRPAPRSRTRHMVGESWGTPLAGYPRHPGGPYYPEEEYAMGVPAPPPQRSPYTQSFYRYQRQPYPSVNKYGRPKQPLRSPRIKRVTQPQQRVVQPVYNRGYRQSPIVRPKKFKPHMVRLGGFY